jgi:hypothetical protein
MHVRDPVREDPRRDGVHGRGGVGAGAVDSSRGTISENASSAAIPGERRTEEREDNSRVGWGQLGRGDGDSARGWGRGEAVWVFDYTKGSIVEDVVAELEGCGEFVGTYDAIGLESTWKASAEITKKLGGKTVVGTLPPPASGLSEGIKALGLMAFTIALDQKEVGEAVWGKYVAGALEDGSLKTKPDAIVIGKGLEMIQEGLDKQKKGVSAGKVVIAL